MTQADFPIFAEWFQNLASMFRLYASDDQRASMLGAYFQTLERFPLERVRQGYEHLKETAHRWPAPAVWIQAMPKFEGSDLPLMSHAQARASDDAERLFYEGPFCHCRDCVDAHATHLNLRYMPCLDASGQTIRLLHPRTQQPKYLGEWVHGQRLRTWYRLRAEFYDKLHALKPGVAKELQLTGPVTKVEA